jgi:hypothetical protein
LTFDLGFGSLPYASDWGLLFVLFVCEGANSQQQGLGPLVVGGYPPPVGVGDSSSSSRSANESANGRKRKSQIQTQSTKTKSKGQIQNATTQPPINIQHSALTFKLMHLTQHQWHQHIAYSI